VVNNKKQDDHKYGAMRYMANTLGIQLEDTNVSDTIDQPMSIIEKKQAWRKATFQCRCKNELCNHQDLPQEPFAKPAFFWSLGSRYLILQHALVVILMNHGRSLGTHAWYVNVHH
jgi:hypothetical protein